MLLRASTVAFVFFLALALHAQQQAAKPQSALVIQGLGQGEVRLNGAAILKSLQDHVKSICA
jgi:hypothetical protein